MDLVEIVERMKRFEKQRPQKVDSETEKYVLKYKPVRLEDYIEPDFYVRPPGTSIKNERIKIINLR